MFFGDLCVHFETLLGKKKHTYATIKEMKKRSLQQKVGNKSEKWHSSDFDFRN